MHPSILIIEDDPFTARSHQLELEKASFTVTLASNGRQALNLLEKHLPNLIILDLIMPDLDGFDTLDYLHTSPRYHKTPIIVISNLEQPEDIQKCSDLGATQFISKNSLKYSILIDNIRQILQKS